MLVNAFDKIALSLTNKVAIYGDCGTYKYEDLYEMSLSIAESMEKLGLSGQHTLVVESPSNGEFVSIYLACARAGVCIVPIDTRLSVEEVTTIWEDASPSGAIVFNPEGNLAKSVASILDSCQKHDVFEKFSLYVKKDIKANPLIQPGDLVVQYSSGSTGKPKGVVLSRDNIYHKVVNWNKTISAVESDRYLNTLTLGHCYGLYVHTLSALLAGASVYMMDTEAVLPNRICNVIHTECINIFGTLPYMFQMFNRMKAESVDFSSIRYLISGSAPLAESVWKTFEEKFGRGINQVYGLTEIGLILFNTNDMDSGSVGKPTANMEIRLVNSDGTESQGNDSAEMVVRCSSMSRGYLNNPEDQRAMFKDGWLFTKDIVKRRGGGAFEICGRISQFINVAGNKVSPLEVEEFLSAHKDINEAAVIGMRSETTIEKVVAYIVTEKGGAITAKDLIKFCGAGLTSYKVPAKVVFVDSLPKSPLGKVLKSKLG